VIEIGLREGRSLVVEPGFETNHLCALLAALEREVIGVPSLRALDGFHGAQIWLTVRQPTGVAASIVWQNECEWSSVTIIRGPFVCVPFAQWR
jgi:hypothetical protein